MDDLFKDLISAIQELSGEVKVLGQEVDGLRSELVDAKWEIENLREVLQHSSQ